MTMDTTKFFDAVRAKPFGGTLSQPEVDGINTLLLAGASLTIPAQLAYLLATVYHETAATMQPVTEYGSAAYLRAKPYWPYIGRGYVQLTWKANYAKADAELGLGTELVDNPDKALDPAIAAKIAVLGMTQGWFTGKKLSDYITPAHVDFVNARRIINGTDKAALVASYAEDFLAAINGAKPE